MNEIVKKVEDWINAGIISVKIGRKILAAEGVDADTALQIHSGNKLVRVISILGSLLVGLGVILFLGKNWHPRFYHRLHIQKSMSGALN